MTMQSPAVTTEEAAMPRTKAHLLCQKDAPFALRGLLGGTVPGFRRMDGFAQPVPRISPNGSRSLHSSRALSEPTKGFISNRPLSPHLPLKKPQLSATYSISHRIFGAALVSLIMLPPIAMKFSLIFDV